MNRYFLIHRLTGPAILLLLGTVALLHEAHLVSWDIFVPLLLILIGVIKLAQRAAMANEPYPPAPPYPGSGPVPYSAPPQAPPSQPQSAIVPASNPFGQSSSVIDPNKSGHNGDAQ